MSSQTSAGRATDKRTTTQYPAGGPDWATVARWVDAGRPSLNPDGTWETPAEGESP